MKNSTRSTHTREIAESFVRACFSPSFTRLFFTTHVGCSRPREDDRAVVHGPLAAREPWHPVMMSTTTSAHRAKYFVARAIIVTVECTVNLTSHVVNFLGGDTLKIPKGLFFSRSDERNAKREDWVFTDKNELF